MHKMEYYYVPCTMYYVYFLVTEYDILLHSISASMDFIMLKINRVNRISTRTILYLIQYDLNNVINYSN